jgi:hypothetical protein
MTGRSYLSPHWIQLFGHEIYMFIPSSFSVCNFEACLGLFVRLPVVKCNVIGADQSMVKLNVTHVFTHSVCEGKIVPGCGIVSFRLQPLQDTPCSMSRTWLDNKVSQRRSTRCLVRVSLAIRRFWLRLRPMVPSPDFFSLGC